MLPNDPETVDSANSYLDVIDLKILEALEADGRLTNVELAERVALSPSPCLRRVRRLEAEGVIEGYGAKINRTKVGLGLTAFVEVKLERPREADAEHFGKSMQVLPQVLSCYLISGQPDFLMEVVVGDLAQYSNSVLKSLRDHSEIKEVHSSFVLQTVKAPATLPWRYIKPR
jgi:Lrp/AsnC family transcriptional regulator, leucine-responsive regulatory protein